MSKKARYAAVLFPLIAVLIISVGGCSRFSGPSDEEVLKAIDASGILKSNTFSITGPLMIVDRGGRSKDGSWLVKVKLTLRMQKPDGTMTEPTEKTVSVKILKGKDAAGKSTWTAVL